MNKNMGSRDRMLRTFVVAPLLVVAGIVLGPGGWLAVVLYVLAAVMVLTSAVSFCPLYTLFGLRTCPAPSADAGKQHAASR